MANINDSIRQLEAKIEAQHNKASRAATTTLIGGVIIVVIIFGYFLYMSSFTSEMMEPQEVSQMAVGGAVEQIDKLGDTAHEYVEKDAPAMIGSLIRSGVKEHLPEGRKSLETTLTGVVTKTMDAYEKDINTAVDDVLKKYGSNIKDFATQLQTEEGTKDFEDSLYKVIEEAIEGEQIAADLDSYGMALKDVETTIVRVSDPATRQGEADEALAHLVAVIRELSTRSELNKVNLSGLKLDQSLIAPEGGDMDMGEPATGGTDRAKPAAKADSKPAAKADAKPASK